MIGETRGIPRDTCVGKHASRGNTHPYDTCGCALANNLIKRHNNYNPFTSVNHLVCGLYVDSE